MYISKKNTINVDLYVPILSYIYKYINQDYIKLYLIKPNKYFYLNISEIKFYKININTFYISVLLKL